MNLALSILIPFAPLVDPKAAQHQSELAWVALYFATLGTLAIIWIVIFARLLIFAPYDIYKKAQLSSESAMAKTEEKLEDQRDIAIKQVVERAVDFIKSRPPKHTRYSRCNAQGRGH